MSSAGVTGRVASGTGHVWERLRSVPERTPLRVKLITALLTLVIIALAVSSFASRSILGGYLMRQAGNRLTNYYQQVSGYISYGHIANYVILGGGLEQVWLLNSHGQQITVPGPHGPIQAPVPPPQIPASHAWLTANAGREVTVPGQSGSSWLVITQQIPNVPVQDSATGEISYVTATLVVGTDLGNINQAIGYLSGIDLLISAAVIVILAMAGIAVVRASLRPLTDIEQTAAAIAAGDLSSRVPDRDPRTEVGRLGRSLNTMLAQIETAFDARAASELAARGSEERMRQFVADASHELRTPLTAIRGYAEYYRQRGGLKQVSGGPARPVLGNGSDTAPATAGPAPRDPSSGPAGEGPLARADMDRIMQRVEQESSRMGVLVEDMLLLARLDQQRQLEQRTVDMLTLAGDAVNDARVVAPDRNISLTVGTGAALLVVGDEVRLRQVIGNLMSNALNHTPDGTPVEVRVRSGSLDEWRLVTEGAARAPQGAGPASQGAGPASQGAARAPQGAGPAAQGAGAAAQAGGHAPPNSGSGAFATASRDVQPLPAVILEVADQGPGLTSFQAEHAFERFYRADQARTRKAGGAGLGLAIVAALVAAHGGNVWVESAAGGGATFRIAIPLAPEARDSEPDPGDDAGPDILDSHAALDPVSGPAPPGRPGGIALRRVTAGPSGRKPPPRAFASRTGSATVAPIRS
jgi:two-component system OmpR family sensor kinase